MGWQKKIREGSSRPSTKQKGVSWVQATEKVTETKGFKKHENKEGGIDWDEKGLSQKTTDVNQIEKGRGGGGTTKGGGEEKKKRNSLWGKKSDGQKKKACLAIRGEEVK